MNLFGFFVRLTHHRDMRKWESATAVFTGKCEKATIRTKPQSLAGRTMNIRYRKDKPFIFENDLPEE